MRRRVAQLFTSISLAAALSSGCGPSVDRPDAAVGDASLGPQPPTPTIETVATPVPWPVTTLRGRADDAKRVIVRGSENPLVTSVLPDGTYCIDIPLPSPGEYALAATSQNEAGRFSAMAAMATVEFDPAAPPPVGLTTCSGEDPAGCSMTTEICDNGRDDDCNGRVDDLDPACTDCVEDILEPNDDVAAPRLDPGRYESLQYCDGDDDYYGVYARVGDAIRVRVFFTHADGDLDAELLDTDRSTVVASSTTTDDDELLMYTATSEGEHKIRVFSTTGASNGYTLDIDVTPM